MTTKSPKPAEEAAAARRFVEMSQRLEGDGKTTWPLPSDPVVVRECELPSLPDRRNEVGENPYWDVPSWDSRAAGLTATEWQKAYNYQERGLPAGLKMDTNGQITGTPTKSEKATVTVTLTRTNQASGSTCSVGDQKERSFNWEIVQKPTP